MGKYYLNNHCSWKFLLSGEAAGKAFWILGRLTISEDLILTDFNFEMLRVTKHIWNISIECSKILLSILELISPIFCCVNVKSSLENDVWFWTSALLGFPGQLLSRNLHHVSLLIGSEKTQVTWTWWAGLPQDAPCLGRFKGLLLGLLVLPIDPAKSY